MFRRAVKNLIRSELFRNQNLQQQKNLRRALQTVQQTFNQHNEQLAKNENDIIIYSPCPMMTIPDSTIDEYVWDFSNQWSDKPAMVDGITGRQLTYGQLRDKCRALAVRLQTVFKLQYGDTIAVCLPNSIEFPIVSLAGNEAAVVVTTVNPIYTSEEIAKQLLDSGAKVIFGQVQMCKTLEEAVKMSKMDVKIVYIKEHESETIPASGISFSELTDTRGIDYSNLKTFNNRENDVSMLPYSSGTTGLCKGVELTHRNIVSNMIMINSDTGNGAVVAPTTDTHQEVIPCVLPFFHIYGMTVTLFSKLAIGAKIVTLPKFHPETFLNCLAEHKATVLHLVPPIIMFMGHSNLVQPKHTDSIKYVMSGAAPMGASDAERFNLKAPKAQFFQGYGLTESAPVVLVNFIGNKNYASVGRPGANTEAKIVLIDDPNMLGVGPNVTGELWVRGPQIMKGYHNNDKATKETVTPDGWLRTGDIGYYDENHEFYITDRLKELIKVKGFQVAPAELEEILRDHPKIADAAVIGIPDQRSGELPRAFVVPKVTDEITEKEIQDYVAKKVAVYKKLDGGVEFVTSIPKNATGKILRRELKRIYCPT